MKTYTVTGFWHRGAALSAVVVEGNVQLSGGTVQEAFDNDDDFGGYWDRVVEAETWEEAEQLAVHLEESDDGTCERESNRREGEPA